VSLAVNIQHTLGAIYQRREVRWGKGGSAKSGRPRTRGGGRPLNMTSISDDYKQIFCVLHPENSLRPRSYGRPDRKICCVSDFSARYSPDVHDEGGVGCLPNASPCNFQASNIVSQNLRSTHIVLHKLAIIFT